MNEKKGISVLVIILLLAGLIAISALFVNLILCSNCFPFGELQQPQTARVPAGGLGLTPGNMTYETPGYSFEEAFLGLRGSPDLAGDHNSSFQISYIQGQNVDEMGRAARWLFETKSVGGTDLRVFDRHGSSVIPWNVTDATEDINTDAIISPSVLFSQSRSIILRNGSFSSAQARDIELTGTVYTLTITSATTQTVMRFNATTGALIE
jgi:hypothetical protein